MKDQPTEKKHRKTELVCIYCFWFIFLSRFRYVHESAFTATAGEREEIVNLLIFMTDGGTYPSEFKPITLEQVIFTKSEYKKIFIC